MANRIGSGVFNSTDLHVDGTNPESNTGFFWCLVGPDFGRTLGIPLLQGREFNDTDLTSSAKVALINKTFADRYLSGRTPVGHQIQVSPFEPATIIGVAADSKYADVREEPTPTAYLLFSPSESAMTVALRTRGNPMNLLPEVRGALADLNPDLALLEPMTLQSQFEDTYSDERLFAGIALFLLAGLSAPSHWPLWNRGLQGKPKKVALRYE